MLESAVLAIIVAILLWYYCIRPLSHWTRLGVKQSNPVIFLGDSWRMILKLMSFNDFIDKMYNLHSEARYIGFYNHTKPILLLRDPEIIKQITVKHFEHFIDHAPFTDPDTDPIWSNALLSLKGERWKKMRKTMSPVFTTSKIKTIYILMLETAEQFVKHFLEKNVEINELEMRDVFSRLTNDIIATVAFGAQVDSFRKDKNIFFEMGKKISYVSTVAFFGHRVFPKLSKNLGLPFLNRAASNYFCEVIDETIKLREEHNIVRNDMVHLMLEARKDNGLKDKGNSNLKMKLSNEEIISQSISFFIAGFDAISVTLCYAAYELAVNKHIQDHLRQEINEIKRDGKVSYEDLINMKYMDMVLNEVLRKWPPFAFFTRICNKPFTIEPNNENEKPQQLSINQEVWIPIYGLHRDPKNFPNPEYFDPERFSDENKANNIPYSYIPFGAGPRMCIANRFSNIEVKVLLSNLLLQFEIVPTKRTPIPLVLRHDMTQLPKDGFWLGLKRLKF